MAPKSTPRSFANIGGDFCRQPLTVKVLHIWEAINFRRGNALMGLEMLLLDLSGQTMQGFVAANRIFRFEASLKSKAVYELNNFTLVPARAMYRVSPKKLCAIFTDQTALKEVDGAAYEFDGNAFRTRSYEELSLIADRNGDLFDILGRVRTVTGENLYSTEEQSLMAGKEPVNSKEKVLLHVELNGGETIKVYLWDKIAEMFRKQWNSCPTKPVVILVTAINPRTFAGVLTLSTTSSTRMFFDKDTPLGMDAQQDVTVEPPNSALTKLATLTIAEIKEFLKSEPSQTIRFYCLATIEDVNRDAQWNYISCTGCKTKLRRSETTLICTNEQCSEPSTVGLTRYRFELSVRDTTGSATFVVLDDVGQQLAGQTAAELMDNLSVATTNAEGHTYTTVPQCLLDTIGSTYNFQIKLTPYNFTATRQTITVTRLLEPTTKQDVNQAEETQLGAALPESGSKREPVEGGDTVKEPTPKNTNLRTQRSSQTLFKFFF